MRVDVLRDGVEDLEADLFLGARQESRCYNLIDGCWRHLVLSVVQVAREL